MHIFCCTYVKFNRNLHNATIHESREVIKSYKKMFYLKNRLWLLKFLGRPATKMLKRWSRKTTRDIKSQSLKMKGNTKRGREK